MEKIMKHLRLGEVTVIAIFLVVGTWLFTYKLKLVSPTYDERLALVDAKYVVTKFRWDTVEAARYPPLAHYIYGWVFRGQANSEFNKLLYFARVTLLPVYLIGAVSMYAVVKRWFGMMAGFTSMMLYIFHPEILAHARLLKYDVLFAVTMFFSLVTYYVFLKKPTFTRIILAGLSLGLALLSKPVGLMLLPLYLVFSFIFLFTTRKIYPSCSRLQIPPPERSPCLAGRQASGHLSGDLQYTNPSKLGISRRLLGLVGIYTIALVVLHGGYLFRETGRIPQAWQSQKFGYVTSKPLVRPLLFLLPNAYLKGLDESTFISENKYWGYLWGEYYEYGRRDFFPRVFLIKTPLALLILVGVTLILWILKKLPGPPLFIPLLLLVITVYFLYFMFFNRINNGLRYILFVQPLVILLSASIVKAKLGPQLLKLVKVTVAILLVWYVWDTISIAPFYLAYANETIGGPKNLWKYVADSSIDWGQDEKFFDLYHQIHPELIINPQVPTAGKIALSVNRLNLDPQFNVHWLRRLKKEPIDEVGYTWLIFEVGEADLNKLQNSYLTN